MASGFTFDYRELIQYGISVQQAREKSDDRAKNAFLRKQGSKLLRVTKAEGKTSGMNWSGHVKPMKYADSKHYRETIKRGKPFEFIGSNAIRVYSYAPHAHLLEYGHRVVSRSGKSTGKTAKAFRVFENARKTMEAQFLADCVKWYEGKYKDLW